MARPRQGCSYNTTGDSEALQLFWECRSCGLDAVCEFCATTCHAGCDVVVDDETTLGYCDCGAVDCNPFAVRVEALEKERNDLAVTLRRAQADVEDIQTEANVYVTRLADSAKQAKALRTEAAAGKQALDALTAAREAEAADAEAATARVAAELEGAKKRCSGLEADVAAMTLARDEADTARLVAEKKTAQAQGEAEAARAKAEEAEKKARRLQDADARCTALCTDLELANAANAKLRESLAAASGSTAASERLQTEIAQLQKEAGQASEAYASLAEELDAANGRVKVLEDAKKLLKNAESGIAGYQAEVEARDARIAALEKEAGQASEAYASLAEELDAANGRVKALEDAKKLLKNAESGIAGYQAEVEARDARIAALEKEAGQASEAYASLAEELDAANGRVKALEDAKKLLKNAESGIAGYQAEVEARDARIVALEKELAAGVAATKSDGQVDLEATVARLQREAAQASTVYHSLLEELEVNNVRADAAEARLEAAKDDMKALEVAKKALSEFQAQVEEQQREASAAARVHAKELKAVKTRADKAAKKAERDLASMRGQYSDARREVDGFSAQVRELEAGVTSAKDRARALERQLKAANKATKAAKEAARKAKVDAVPPPPSPPSGLPYPIVALAVVSTAAVSYALGSLQ